MRPIHTFPSSLSRSAEDSPRSSAKISAAANPAYNFVLSRDAGSCTHFNLWLRCGTQLLAHWTVLADGMWGLQQPCLFLFQSPAGCLPAARYDEGPCQFLPVDPDEEAAAECLTWHQAIAQGGLCLQLEGQHLQGTYLLQRVGAGRGHTWQLTALHKGKMAAHAPYQLLTR